MSIKNKECFSNDDTYSRFMLGLNLEKLKKLENLDPQKTIFGLLFLYIMTALLIFISIQISI